MSDELNFVLQARREKLAELTRQGVEPFAYSFDRSNMAADATALLGTAEQGPTVRMAGRLVAWRAHGKTTFAHLADATGRIQLYFRRDALGEERYALLDQFDLGDVVGVAGPLFRTRTGTRFFYGGAMVTVLAAIMFSDVLYSHGVVSRQCFRHVAEFTNIRFVDHQVIGGHLFPQRMSHDL